MLAAVLGHEQSGGLPLDRGGDENRAGLGGALDARGDIGRVAEHFARRVDHHLPGIKADSCGEFGRAFSGVSRVDFDKRALDRERGAHSALSVVLLRVRVAEQRHQPVAKFFQHMAAETVHRRGGLVEIAVDEGAPILGVKLRSHACRPDEVTEHHGDRTTLGDAPRRRRRRGARRLGGFGGPKRGDRLEETLAVPQWHAQLIEVALCQIRQDFGIDFAIAKCGLILTETEGAQPSPDVHDCIRPTGINDGLIERTCPACWPRVTAPGRSDPLP